ncbi:hypothetical protein GCM10010401_04960 [Rarobacter faecitabidus]
MAATGSATTKPENASQPVGVSARASHLRPLRTRLVTLRKVRRLPVAAVREVVVSPGLRVRE